VFLLLGPTRPRASQFQHLAPTVGAPKSHSRDGSQERNFEGYDLHRDPAKAVLLAEKKVKAVLVGDVLHEALEDGAVNSKRHCQKNLPTLEGSVRTCSSEGLPRAPLPGFTPRG
jgi:hypothetical protein